MKRYSASPRSASIQPARVWSGSASTSGLNHAVDCRHWANSSCTCWRRPHLVVALILVVREGGEVPDLVGQLAHGVAPAQRVEQRGRRPTRVPCARRERLMRRSRSSYASRHAATTGRCRRGSSAAGSGTSWRARNRGRRTWCRRWTARRIGPERTPHRATLAPHDGPGEARPRAARPAPRPRPETIPDEDPRGSQRLHPVQRWGPGGRGGIRRASGALRHRGGELRLRRAHRASARAACASSTTKS